MKKIPSEDFGPSYKNRKGGSGKCAKAGSQTLSGPTELVKYQLALKAISRRLDSYADHELPDRGILDLLEDTRAQVLSLHLARKQLNHKGKTTKQQNKASRRHRRGN